MIPGPLGDDAAQRPQRFYSKETNPPKLTPPSPPQKHAHKNEFRRAKTHNPKNVQTATKRYNDEKCTHSLRSNPYFSTQLVS